MNMREMPDRVEARDMERGRARAYSLLLNRFTEHVFIEKPCITSLRASILEYRVFKHTYTLQKSERNIIFRDIRQRNSGVLPKGGSLLYGLAERAPRLMHHVRIRSSSLSETASHTVIGSLLLLIHHTHRIFRLLTRKPFKLQLVLQFTSRKR